MKLEGLQSIVGHKLDGFEYAAPPASYIDAISLVAAATLDLKPQSLYEILSCVTHAADEIRRTSTYKQLKKQYSQRCWRRVTTWCTHILHDASPLHEQGYRPALFVCTYPHVSASDPWLVIPLLHKGREVPLDEKLVEQLTPRATKLFKGYGRMVVEGGSDHISPSRYTVFPDEGGHVDIERICAGLARVLADAELEAAYRVVLAQAERTLFDMRMKNPAFFSADPGLALKFASMLSYTTGGPRILH